MKKIYRYGATILAVLAGLAAIGTGALIVATAVVIGGLMALAGKLAVRGFSVRQTASQHDDGVGFEEKVTV